MSSPTPTPHTPLPSSPISLPTINGLSTQTASTLGLKQYYPTATSPTAQSKDISHLLDRPGHGRLSKSKNKTEVQIPPTKIPAEHHIKEVSAAPPQSPDQHSEFSEKDRMWHTTVFPSLRPTGRQEVLLLDQWLNSMLVGNVSKVQDPIESVKEAQQLYSMCFHEIIRQVYVHCAERGQLMEKIWYRYLQLFEHILKLREAERMRYQKRLEEQKGVYQQLYRDKDGQFNKVYLALAAEKEQETMTKDKMERAVLLLHAAHKRRVKREARLRRALQKLRAEYIKLQTTVASGLPGSPALARAALGRSPMLTASMPTTSSAVQLGHQSSLSSLLSSSSEDEAEEEEDVLPFDLSTFSEKNVVLTKQLDHIKSSLKGIHGALAGKKREDNTATLGNLDEVIASVSEALQRISSGSSLLVSPGSESPMLDLGSASPSVSPLAARRKQSAVKQIPDKPKNKKQMVDKASQHNEEDVVVGTDPGPFAQLLSPTLHTHAPRPMDRGWVLCCLDYIYARRAMRGAGDPDAMTEFVHALFLEMHGTRTVAEQALLDFLDGVRRYHAESVRMCTFLRILGAVDGMEVGERAPYTPDDAAFYLYILSMFRQQYVSPDGPQSDEIAAFMYITDEDGSRRISADSATLVVDDAFGSRDAESSVAMGLVQIVETEANGSNIDFDFFLDAATTAYHALCADLEARLVDALHEYTAVGASYAAAPAGASGHHYIGGDGGVVAYDELHAALLAFSPSVPHELAMAIFREALVGSKTPLVPLEGFVEAARRRGLLRYSLAGEKAFDYNKKEHTASLSAVASERHMDFLALNWTFKEQEVLTKIRELQGSLSVVPKISQNLRDCVASVRRGVESRDVAATAAQYRVLNEQLHFAATSTNRIVVVATPRELPTP